MTAMAATAMILCTRASLFCASSSARRQRVLVHARSLRAWFVVPSGRCAGFAAATPPDPQQPLPSRITRRTRNPWPRMMSPNADLRKLPQQAAPDQRWEEASGREEVGGRGAPAHPDALAAGDALGQLVGKGQAHG